ncbi:Proteophosphoglycan 5, related [Neospora caninum Liverpool]|uniref:Fanconi-associated nuclease n=1 Tax=Neospora caninum (strain Liverpool) TaxID=572307 RepID=F0VQH7_NEOCL|nr:Proteophosphoglycan 5, related [Neospora caninum Liverpool]CBZ55974.1 Proteophosphoglycan 5, related [Neospora caninum Liverpool]|eukprot:XP_003886000.1 Proteophosphoglycan 5, related [Neospora caninum Liverpool]
MGKAAMDRPPPSRQANGRSPLTRTAGAPDTPRDAACAVQRRTARAPSESCRSLASSQAFVEVIEVSSHDEESASFTVDTDLRGSAQTDQSDQPFSNRQKRTRATSLRQARGATLRTSYERDENDRECRGSSPVPLPKGSAQPSTAVTSDAEDCREVRTPPQFIPPDGHRRDATTSEVCSGMSSELSLVSPSRGRMRPGSLDGGCPSTCLATEQGVASAQTPFAVDSECPGAGVSSELASKTRDVPKLSESRAVRRPTDERDGQTSERMRTSGEASVFPQVSECTCSTLALENGTEEPAAGVCPPWMWNFTAPVYACLEASCTFNSHLFSPSEKLDLRRLAHLLALPVLESDEKADRRETSCGPGLGADAAGESAQTRGEPGASERGSDQALSPGARLLFCRVLLQFSRTPRRELDFHSFPDGGQDRGRAALPKADETHPSRKAAAGRLPSPWLRLTPLLNRSRREVADPHAALSELRACGLLTVWDNTCGVHTAEDEATNVSGLRRGILSSADPLSPEQGDTVEGSDLQQAKAASSRSLVCAERGDSVESDASSLGRPIAPPSPRKQASDEASGCVRKLESASASFPGSSVPSGHRFALTPGQSGALVPGTGASSAETSSVSMRLGRQGAPPCDQRRGAAATLKDSLIAAFHCLTVPELQRLVMEVEAAMTSPRRASPVSSRFPGFSCSPLAARLRRLLPANRRNVVRLKGEQRLGPTFKRRPECLRFLCAAAEMAFASHRKTQGEDCPPFDASSWDALFPRAAPRGGLKPEQVEQQPVRMKKLTHFFKLASPAASENRSKWPLAQPSASKDRRGQPTRSQGVTNGASPRPSVASEAEVTSCPEAPFAPWGVQTPLRAAAEQPAESGPSLSQGECFLQMLREMLVACVGPLAAFQDQQVLRTWLVAFFAFHVVHSAFLNFFSRSAPPAAVLWTTRARPGRLRGACPISAAAPASENASSRSDAEETVFGLTAAAVAPAVTRLSGLVTYQLEVRLSQPGRRPGADRAVAELGRSPREDEAGTDNEEERPTDRRSVGTLQTSPSSPDQPGESEEESLSCGAAQRVLASACDAPAPSAAAAPAQDSACAAGGGREQTEPLGARTAGRNARAELCEACGGSAAAKKPRQLVAPPLRCVCCCCEYARSGHAIFPSRAAVFVYAAALLDKWRLAALLWGGLVLPAQGGEENPAEAAVLDIVESAAEKLRMYVEEAEGLLYRHLRRDVRRGEQTAAMDGKAVERAGAKESRHRGSEGPGSGGGKAELCGNPVTSHLSLGDEGMADWTEDSSPNSARLPQALEAAAPPSKLFRFTPHFVWAKTISHGLELVEQTKRHHRAVELLRLLLRFHGLRQVLAKSVASERGVRWPSDSPSLRAGTASRDTHEGEDVVRTTPSRPDLSAGGEAFWRRVRESCRHQPAVCRALSRHAGQWYNRLMVLLKIHLKHPTEALAVAVDCLREPRGAVSLAERLAMGKRATALAKAFAYAAEKATQTGEEGGARRCGGAAAGRHARKRGRAEGGDSNGEARQGHTVPQCWEDVRRLVGRPRETDAESGASGQRLQGLQQEGDSAGADLAGESAKQKTSRVSRSCRRRGTISADETSSDNAAPERIERSPGVSDPKAQRSRASRGPERSPEAAAAGPLPSSRESASLRSWTRFFPRDVHARLLETVELQRLLEKELPHSVVYARPLEATQQTGKSSVFFGWDGQLLSVEELCMQHYAMAGDWRGVHDEGRSLRTLFRLVMFDANRSLGEAGASEEETRLERGAHSGPSTQDADRDRAEADGASSEAKRASSEAKRERGGFELSADRLKQGEEAAVDREDGRCWRRRAPRGTRDGVGNADAKAEGSMESARDAAFVPIVFLPPSEPTVPSSISRGKLEGGDGEASFDDVALAGGVNQTPTRKACEREGDAQGLESAETPFSLEEPALKRALKVQEHLDLFAQMSRSTVAEAVGRTVRRLYGMRLPGVSWRGPWQDLEEAPGGPAEGGDSAEAAQDDQTRGAEAETAGFCGEPDETLSETPGQFVAGEGEGGEGKQEETPSEETHAGGPRPDTPGHEKAAPLEKVKPTVGRSPPEAPGPAREHALDARYRRGIQRERAKEACARFFSMLAYGIGGKGLSEVFRLLSDDFAYWAGGLPDLLLWRVSPANAPAGTVCTPQEAAGEKLESTNTRDGGGPKGDEKLGHLGEILFAEVKGPRDRLSEKQKCWLAHFLRAGVPCEVCKVLPPVQASEDLLRAPAASSVAGECLRGPRARRETRATQGDRPHASGGGSSSGDEASASVSSDPERRSEGETHVGAPPASPAKPQGPTKRTAPWGKTTEREDGEPRGVVDSGETQTRHGRETKETNRGTVSCEASRLPGESQTRQSKRGKKDCSFSGTRGGAQQSSVSNSELDKVGEKRGKSGAQKQVAGSFQTRPRGLPRVRVRADWEEHDAEKVEALCRRTRKKVF